jgi:hypothetical protein
MLILQTNTEHSERRIWNRVICSREETSAMALLCCWVLLRQHSLLPLVVRPRRLKRTTAAPLLLLLRSSLRTRGKGLWLSLSMLFWFWEICPRRGRGELILGTPRSEEEAGSGALRKAPAEVLSFYQTGLGASIRNCTKPLWVSIRVSKLITIITIFFFFFFFKIPSFDLLWWKTSGWYSIWMK